MASVVPPPVFGTAPSNAAAENASADLDNLDFQLLHEYLFEEPGRQGLVPGAAAPDGASGDAGIGGGGGGSILTKRPLPDAAAFAGLEDEELGDEEDELGDELGDEDLEEEDLEEEGGGKKRKSEPRPKSQAQIDRRRERNRILARRTRLRKKFFFESLQKQVAELQRENLVLKDIVMVKMSDVASTILKQCDSTAVPPIVTDNRENATETLNRSDFTLMRTLQAVQRSFCITDPSLPDNPIVFASQKFLDSTGYTMDQVLGRNCRFLQGPETDRRKVAQVRRGIVAGVDTAACLLNYRADGTKFWNQLFVAALRDVNKRIVNYVGVQCEVPHPPENDEVTFGFASGVHGSSGGGAMDDFLLDPSKVTDGGMVTVSSEGQITDGSVVSHGDDAASSSSS